MTDQPAPALRGRWRRHARPELWRFLELFALCGFVVVQPLLEVIGGSPDFFIFHGVNGGQVVMLVALFVLVPPVVLWGVGALSGLAGPRVRRVVHLAAVSGLFGLFAIEVGKNLTPVRGGLLVALAVAVTAVIVVGYVQLDAARQLLRFAAVGPLVFVLLFAFVSPASAVVLADDRPSRGGVPDVTGPHPPIVMIILDELAMLSLLDETGGVDAERFPNFARLAGDSTWYRNATAAAGWTPYAIPAMLSGRWPSEELAPHHASYPDNLFTLLGEVYQISASESITELCPPWYCGDRPEWSRGGLPVALAESTSLLGEIVSPVDPVRNPYDDYAEPTVQERLGAMAAARANRPDFRFAEGLTQSQPVRFQDFMADLYGDPAAEPSPPGTAPAAPGGAGAEATAAGPELDFLHLLLPHTPWSYLPDGMRYHNARGLSVDGPWWGRLALQRYLLQLQYTDGLLGETLDALQATGRYDESLMVLTADHGVSLTPGGAGSRELGPTDPGIVELAWVPLFIKEPDQTEPVVQDGNWQHVDLLPTIADYAGVRVPWRVDGISWRREQRTTPEKTYYPYVDQPGTLDGPAGLARILADPTAIPPVPPAPLPELVGTAVGDHPVLDGDGRAEVENADQFEDVDLDSGIVPALVHGTVPDRVPEGTPLAIAVNGRIGAVVPVVAGDEGERQFAGLVEDTDRFVAGENQLELFLVPDGSTLHRL
ncbi:MAG: sulfatase-like hydrolase/transferase [Micromonosporaceae bacterium]|nr:sulfatase-like hydrolase/transferase [Micromonosporaceae bacterium]